MSISKNNVIICPPTKRSIRKIAKFIGNDDYDWAYLGEDVTNALAVEEWIEARGKRIDISERLQETANSLRQPYIDYIGKLSVEHNSMLWWASSLSEKNPFVSKTFLYSCYIKVAFSLFESHKQDNLILFVENRSLRLSLIANISEILGYDVLHIEQNFSHVLESLTDRMEFIVKHGWFVINNLYRIVLTQHIYRLNKICYISGKGNSKNDLTLIHTWVDQRSFTENNDFQDVYFGMLGKYMKEKGKNIVIVPYILHTVPYAKTIKKIINCEKHFLVPSAHLRIFDILQSLKATTRKPANKVYPYFENMDISYLIYTECKNDWKSTRSASSYLFYHIVGNWKEQGIPIERFIYTYENHTWEKLFCIAFRNYYPSTHLIGYQHSQLPLMLLNYFISHVERDIIPFPDRVITNGRYFKEILVNSNYNPDKVQCGGAIRYATLLSKLKNNDKIDIRTNIKYIPTILVTPTIEKNEAVELVWKMIEANRYMDECEVIIKCHPTMPFEQFSESLGIKHLPENMSIVETPINDLLKNADILLYTTSTVAIEAFANAVPLIHVKSDYTIDKDSLDFNHQLRESVSSPLDIALCIKKVLENNVHIRTYMRNNMDMLHEVFGEVDEHTYDCFIK